MGVYLPPNPSNCTHSISTAFYMSVIPLNQFKKKKRRERIQQFNLQLLLRPTSQGLGAFGKFADWPVESRAVINNCGLVFSPWGNNMPWSEVVGRL